MGNDQTPFPSNTNFCIMMHVNVYHFGKGLFRYLMMVQVFLWDFCPLYIQTLIRSLYELINILDLVVACYNLVINSSCCPGLSESFLIVAPCLVHWWIRYTCRSEKFYVHTQPSRSWHTVENFIAFWRLLATDEHVESLGKYFYCRLQLGPGWNSLIRSANLSPTQNKND